ncbi:MAG: DNA polymerase IV [Cyclobacteriaceae bacterium]|nr:DNA polymerase IV [Cyclobacteriaceae bacterium]
MNQNSLIENPDAVVLFIDMNSFFASCEQQVNYWLRNRPVGVCVYTGKYGCIIAPSVEAKLKGVKTGMRLDEAIKICPDLVPLETNPNRYREYHVKIIQILKKYSDDVIPKSIDEAIVNLTSYKLIYKNPTLLAYTIKREIKEQVGEWLRCSIGIAPNALLAKLASNLKKPDGLVVIDQYNIDNILAKLQLTDLPGINKGIACRLKKSGIMTPLEIRYSTPEKLRLACKSIVGVYWYKRLNFAEVDIMSHPYKSMQSMRQISAELRKNPENIQQLFITLCMTLERRMMLQKVLSCTVSIYVKYESGYYYKDHFYIERGIQDGMEIYNKLNKRINKSKKDIINSKVKSLGVQVSQFIPQEAVQLHLFENTLRKDTLRKVVYDIKNKYGTTIIQKAAELSKTHILKDAIGFGSVKDLI